MLTTVAASDSSHKKLFMDNQSKRKIHSFLFILHQMWPFFIRNHSFVWTYVRNSLSLSLSFSGEEKKTLFITYFSPSTKKKICCFPVNWMKSYGDECEKFGSSTPNS